MRILLTKKVIDTFHTDLGPLEREEAETVYNVKRVVCDGNGTLNIFKFRQDADFSEGHLGELDYLYALIPAGVWLDVRVIDPT